MVKLINRNIGSFSSLVFLPFIVFKLTYQVQRTLGNIQLIPFQNINPSQNTVLAFKRCLNVKPLFLNLINTFRLVIGNNLILPGQTQFTHPFRDILVGQPTVVNQFIQIKFTIKQPYFNQCRWIIAKPKIQSINDPPAVCRKSQEANSNYF